MVHRKSEMADESDRTIARPVSKIQIFPTRSHHEILQAFRPVTLGSC
jgi:hypothetical protein